MFPPTTLPLSILSTVADHRAPQDGDPSADDHVLSNVDRAGFGEGVAIAGATWKSLSMMTTKGPRRASSPM